MQSSPVYIIVAVDEEQGIGLNNTLPWHFSADMKHFKDVTMVTEDTAKQNAVIMGRKTWESLPEKYRPLPGRRNIVLSTQQNLQVAGATTANSLEQAISTLKSDESIEKIFIIGGGEIFRQGLEYAQTTGLYLTKIHDKFHCDTFLAKIPESFTLKEKLGETVEKNTTLEFLYFFNASSIAASNTENG